jgi:6-pyruvoyltetrahydropterin/6-carboxytetrahydropterin synthase
VYETGTAVRVSCRHRLPGHPPPEGELHAHDYRLTVLVRRPRLPEDGMVVDLDLLDAALGRLAAALRDRDLAAVVGCEPVTVEVFARWAHGRLAAELGTGAAGSPARPPAPPADLHVRVYESAEQFGGYRAPLEPADAAGGSGRR